MQKLLKLSRERIRAVMVAAAATVMVIGNVASVSGAALTDASLQLEDPRPSTTNVNYEFNATNFTTGTVIRCMIFEFDTAADGSGGKPTGMTLTGATAGTNTIEPTLTTQSVDNTNGLLTYSDATGGNPADGEFNVDGITNPSSEGEYFLLVRTYTAQACTGGTEVDTVVIAWDVRASEAVTLSIDPNLQFVCNSVAAGTTVNTFTTTHPSTGTSIDYNNPTDVTTAANGISAHDLQVTTNAAGGYVVYIRHAQNFQNANLDAITNHTGTNASPTTFTAAGTESWGYTTEDASLTGGTANRFTSTPAWAGFSTTNQPVVDNTAATSGSETTRVGHQVGIAADTPAGTYNTEIIYTIVATF